LRAPIAIYAHEDRFALHLKADEAYDRRSGEPLRAYLNIDGIVALAANMTSMRSIPVTASLGTRISPRLRRRGITFIGPRALVLEQLGDKLAAAPRPKKRTSILSGGDEPSRTRPSSQARREARLPGDCQGVMAAAPRHARGSGARQTRRRVEQAQRERHCLRQCDVFLKSSPPGPHIEVQLSAIGTAASFIFSSAIARSSAASEGCRDCPAPNLPDATRRPLELPLAVDMRRARQRRTASSLRHR